MPAWNSTPEGARPASLTGDLIDSGLLAGATVVLLLLLEWLFQVTKPSMFSVLSWSQKVTVLLAAALPITLTAVSVALVLTLLGRPWRAANMVPPAVVLAATALLLVENFTKTVAGFNVGSFKSPVRFLYAAGVVLLIVYFNYHLRKLVVGERFQQWRRALLVGVSGVLVLSAVAAGVRYDPERRADLVTAEGDRELSNVLIFSSDGVSANRMSAYGYERKTTPFLDSRIDQFLISENHLTNAASTAGSTGALLTGKLPTTTGVVQQFHVFQGLDAYEHLPGVLRQLGYYGIEIGERHYADSRDQNLRQGFHVSNSHVLTAENVAPVAWYGRLYPSEQYFLGSTVERIRERIAHAVGIEDMPEAILASTEHQPEWTSDELRIGALKRQIAGAPRPFFAQVHLLNTHGPIFRVRRPRFSAGRKQSVGGERDFLDDAILGWDSYIEEIVGYLEDLGELDNTVLVLNTDHGIAGARNSQRLPLLIRFPNSEHRGRILANTQRIDIAPTLLSYLGVQPPEWMEGQSLIDSAVDPQRPIFSTGWSRSPSEITLSVIQCQRWLQLDEDSGELKEKTLFGHTEPCPTDQLISSEEGRRFIVAQLSDSRHFIAPLTLGGTLTRLRVEDDPEERQLVARAIRDRLTVSRWLDDEMGLARAHWDFWTYRTSPAALVVVNKGDRPLSRQLEVLSGGDREFPVTFHVDDGSETRDYTFERPGAITLGLAPVPPESERLFIIWSDQAFPSDRRFLGVKLATSFNDGLERLERKPDPEGRRRLMQAILDQQIPSRQLDEHLRIAGVHWDFWTRGDQRAALVVQNQGAEPLGQRLAVHSGEGREFPVRFYVDDGDSTREYLFTEPGTTVVALSPVPAAEERLFVVWTDRPWTPDSRDQRVLGIKISKDVINASTAALASNS